MVAFCVVTSLMVLTLIRSSKFWITYEQLSVHIRLSEELGNNKDHHNLNAQYGTLAVTREKIPIKYCCRCIYVQ